MLLQLKRELSNKFQMKDLGKLSYCLGIEFKQNKDKTEFTMGQPKYIASNGSMWRIVSP